MRSDYSLLRLLLNIKMKGRLGRWSELNNFSITSRTESRHCKNLDGDHHDDMRNIVRNIISQNTVFGNIDS